MQTVINGPFYCFTANISPKQYKTRIANITTCKILRFKCKVYCDAICWIFISCDYHLSEVQNGDNQMILNLIGTKIYIWQEESLESEANHCSDPYIVFVKQHLYIIYYFLETCIRKWIFRYADITVYLYVIATMTYVHIRIAYVWPILK